jgi:hypothetical protein
LPEKSVETWRVAGAVLLACRVLFGPHMKPQASVLVELGIPALALVVVALVGVAISLTRERRAAPWFALAAASWLLSTAGLAASGFFTKYDSLPPRLLVLMVPALGLPLLLSFSRLGSALGRDLPVALLVAFHSYRLPLELIMQRAATEGTMPMQMAYTGYNFDIVSGVSALVVGALAAWGYAPRWLLLAWNALASGLLLAILVIAVASLPYFRAFGSEPSRVNTWVAYFPFVWLPAGLVSAALLGHVILWRRLLSHAMRGRALEPLS